MAKFKPAGKKKSSTNPNLPRPAAIPCLIIILSGLVLFSLLFYGFMQSAAR